MASPAGAVTPELRRLHSCDPSAFVGPHWANNDRPHEVPELPDGGPEPVALLPELRLAGERALDGRRRSRRAGAASRARPAPRGARTRLRGRARAGPRRHGGGVPRARG